MKNSSQTQHHRSETKRKEEKKSEAGSKMQGTVANGTVATGSSREPFRYAIEKISNFARIAQLGIFARLAKFR